MEHQGIGNISSMLLCKAALKVRFTEPKVVKFQLNYLYHDIATSSTHLASHKFRPLPHSPEISTSIFDLLSGGLSKSVARKEESKVVNDSLSVLGRMFLKKGI